MARQPYKPETLPDLPDTALRRLLDPWARFMRVEAASGILLLGATVVALGLANSTASEAFSSLWNTPIGFRIGDITVEHTVRHWINDGLMVIFFFLIGLEIKRELVLGELRDLRRAALPCFAALGGMLVPAGIYIAVLLGKEEVSGWGIPMATDIAFVVGCLTLLGSRVPHGLRVMLLLLAIADDIGAILVIAIGYTDDLDWVALALGFAGIGLCLILARVGVQEVPVYALVGVFTWFAFHESGVHATIAGVILGLITPATSRVNEGHAGGIVEQAGRYVSGAGASTLQKLGALLHAQRAGREAISPVERLEQQLHPWVSFVILPLFALANAGVRIHPADLGADLTVAVILGLVVGKPVGVILLSWLAVRSGLARLPDRVTWGMITAGGLLCGIGFTMAIFIAGLAFESQAHLLDTAKLGVLAASFISAVAGLLLLLLTTPRRVKS